MSIVARALPLSVLLLCAVIVPTAAMAQDVLAPGTSLGIASVSNLRDAGGYTTADGSIVRRGIAYRSNQLNPIGPDDMKTFAVYAGAVICFSGLIFAGIRMMSGRFQDASQDSSVRYSVPECSAGEPVGLDFQIRDCGRSLSKKCETRFTTLWRPITSGVSCL